MKRVTQQAEQITQVFDDWLKAEVITSGEGNNNVLDADSDEELKSIREKIALPYGNEGNLCYTKSRDHAQRLWNIYWPLFESTSVSDSDFDAVSSMVQFATQMEQSGGYRRQCYLQASNAANYIARRAVGTGINLEMVVYERLQKRAPSGDLASANISMEGLKRALEDAITRDTINIAAVAKRAQAEFNEMGVEESRSVDGTKNTQISWAQAATDCVIMAAKLKNGELEAVAFREPLSITYLSGDTFYPLAGRIDWMTVIKEKGEWPNPDADAPQL